MRNFSFGQIEAISKYFHKQRQITGMTKNIWNEVESQLFEKLTTEPIKGESK